MQRNRRKRKRNGFRWTIRPHIRFFAMFSRRYRWARCVTHLVFRFSLRPGEIHIRYALSTWDREEATLCRIPIMDHVRSSRPFPPAFFFCKTPKSTHCHTRILHQVSSICKPLLHTDRPRFMCIFRVHVKKRVCFMCTKLLILKRFKLLYFL